MLVKFKKTGLQPSILKVADKSGPTWELYIIYNVHVQVLKTLFKNEFFLNKTSFVMEILGNGALTGEKLQPRLTLMPALKRPLGNGRRKPS